MFDEKYYLSYPEIKDLANHFLSLKDLKEQNQFCLKLATVNPYAYNSVMAIPEVSHKVRLISQDNQMYLICKQMWGKRKSGIN